MIINVAGALLKRKDKYLICRRNLKGSMPGLWEFPGGKVEVGESPKECIKRELKEELGIDAKIGNIFTKFCIYYL